MKYKYLILTIIILFIINIVPVYGETSEELFKKGNDLALEKNYEQAIEYFDQALELDPDNVKILLNKALALTLTGKYKESEICFNKAIDLSPDFADAWHWKGVSYVMQGQLESGLMSIATTFNELDETYEKDVINPGEIYFTDSITFFDKAIELRNDFPPSYYWKGLAFYNMNNYEEALICYDKAIELDPGYTKAINAKEEILNGPGGN